MAMDAPHTLIHHLRQQSPLPQLASAFTAAGDAITQGGVDRDTWLRTVEACVTALAVPDAFTKDDEKRGEKRMRFRGLAGLVFGFLRDVIGKGGDEEALAKITCPVLVACASFLGDEEGRWCSGSVRDTVQEVLTTLVAQHHTGRLSVLVAVHAEQILTTHVKPFFTHRRVRQSGDVAMVTSRQEVEEVWGDGAAEEESWKTERVDCVPVLRWVVLHLEHGQIAPIQHLLFPALLTLLDDHEPRYKTIGAHLTRHVVVQNSAPMDIRRTGLGDVFFNSLLPCLTYHDTLPLLRAALPCIVELVPVIEPVDSEMYHAKLERVVQEGVLRGLSFAMGGNVEVVRTILQIIPDLASRLGLIVIRHLQLLLGITTTLLTHHTHDIPTQLLAARAVLQLVREAWPRVADAYRGMVLKAVAVAWRGLRKDGGGTDSGDVQELKTTLKQICSTLREICGDQIEPDFRLLLHTHATFYKDLVPIAA